MKLVDVNYAAVQKMVNEAVEHDMNELLDKLAEEAIEKAKERIRRNIAITVMSKMEESYNVRYDGRELRITVKISE